MELIPKIGIAIIIIAIGLVGIYHYYDSHLETEIIIDQLIDTQPEDVNGAIIDAMPTPVNGQITDSVNEYKERKTPGVYLDESDK